jgi:hypothetical protein
MFDSQYYSYRCKAGEYNSVIAKTSRRFIYTHINLLHISLQIPTDNYIYIFSHTFYIHDLKFHNKCLSYNATVQKSVLRYLKSRRILNTPCHGVLVRWTLADIWERPNYIHVIVLEQKISKFSIYGEKSVR